VDNYKREKFLCWQNQKSGKYKQLSSKCLELGAVFGSYLINYLIHQTRTLEVAASRRTADYICEVEVSIHHVILRLSGNPQSPAA
jgi:hypothetical protein